MLSLFQDMPFPINSQSIKSVLASQDTDQTDVKIVVHYLSQKFWCYLKLITFVVLILIFFHLPKCYHNFEKLYVNFNFTILGSKKLNPPCCSLLPPYFPTSPPSFSPSFSFYFCSLLSGFLVLNLSCFLSPGDWISCITVMILLPFQVNFISTYGSKLWDLWSTLTTVFKLISAH